ncbi:hypothetical protein K450DRAFT_201101 [Umbelopsis ramanniana AG]|uniref:Uncharacterized protein n=1 Tax=Umbelopsis ramanniana AG TaxID=1314678 RepID=A0AAD5E6H4_UMBRA|nr:uncharacterized protein K450DRAFT_201101 [Umbelopsis ramanniana AG]KAI8577594.1 hypothetical protein K450DRAFT_201101 [Umbelopsis ramanniana AG]
MVIHVPHIIIECTGPNSVIHPGTTNRNEPLDSNHLSTFTNDLLMWSPNASINSSTELNPFNDRELPSRPHASPADSTKETGISEHPSDIRLSTSADSGYDENYQPSVTSYERYNNSGSLTGPTTYSHPIQSAYGYPHRHTNHIVSCILCSLESYRKFQDRMGWPHYLEHPEYENFNMQFVDSTSTNYRKIYPHLTTDDNYKAAEGHVANQSFVTNLGQHRYYRVADKTAINEKQPKQHGTRFMSRFGHQLQRQLRRLIGK